MQDFGNFELSPMLSAFEAGLLEIDHMSQLMRFGYLSHMGEKILYNSHVDIFSSVSRIFWFESSSTFIVDVCKQQRL